ncbi:MAG TPA: hypothetical protein VLA20_01235 [Vicinamibacterales bacterium]|nr:hypothetical protein [Vicinamibacterales bacterium]
MRHRSFAAFALVGFISAAAAGCAQVPQAEVDAAKATVEQAAAAGAADYAPESFQAVQDAQTALDAELTAQADKFSLTRSYGKATELAAALKAAGEKAAADAAAGKEAAKAEATTLIADAKMALTQAQETLAKAPKGKGTAQDLAALKADLDGAAVSITEAEAAFAADSFNEAKAKAEAAKAAAANVVAAVEQAMAARGGR